MVDKKVSPNTAKHDLKATYKDEGDGTRSLVLRGRMHCWNPGTGQWEKYTGS